MSTKSLQRRCFTHSFPWVFKFALSLVNTAVPSCAANAFFCTKLKKREVSRPSASPRTEGRGELHTPRRHSPSAFPPLSTTSRNPHPAYQNGDPASGRQCCECTDTPGIGVEHPAVWFGDAGMLRRLDRLSLIYFGKRKTKIVSCATILSQSGLQSRDCLSRN